MSATLYARTRPPRPDGPVPAVQHYRGHEIRRRWVTTRGRPQPDEWMFLRDGDETYGVGRTLAECWEQIDETLDGEDYAPWLSRCRSCHEPMREGGPPRVCDDCGDTLCDDCAGVVRTFERTVCPDCLATYGDDEPRREYE